LTAIFEDYFSALLSFFAASIFQHLFKRFAHFALVESTAASTLTAAVSVAHFVLLSVVHLLDL
jgi:hypothetical protein